MEKSKAKIYKICMFCKGKGQLKEGVLCPLCKGQKYLDITEGLSNNVEVNDSE